MKWLLIAFSSPLYISTSVVIGCSRNRLNANEHSSRCCIGLHQDATEWSLMAFVFL